MPSLLILGNNDLSKEIKTYILNKKNDFFTLNIVNKVNFNTPKPVYVIDTTNKKSKETYLKYKDYNYIYVSDSSNLDTTNCTQYNNNSVECKAPPSQYYTDDQNVDTSQIMYFLKKPEMNGNLDIDTPTKFPEYGIVIRVQYLLSKNCELVKKLKLCQNNNYYVKNGLYNGITCKEFAINLEKFIRNSCMTKKVYHWGSEIITNFELCNKIIKNFNWNVNIIPLYNDYIDCTLKCDKTPYDDYIEGTLKCNTLDEQLKKLENNSIYKTTLLIGGSGQGGNFILDMIKDKSDLLIVYSRSEWRQRIQKKNYSDIRYVKGDVSDEHLLYKTIDKYKPTIVFYMIGNSNDKKQQFQNKISKLNVMEYLNIKLYKNVVDFKTINDIMKYNI
jgi:hypothetical protein